MKTSKNIAYVCTKEVCEQGHGSKVAYKWVLNDLSTKDHTYRQIESALNRVYNRGEATNSSKNQNETC